MMYTYLPPAKRAQPSPATMKSFVNYTPIQKYAPRHDTDPLLSYPLTLYSRARIQVYQNRESTPLKVLCRQCSSPTTVSLTQQKLFLTAERLLRRADTVSDIERNQANTWAVNYDVGIYEPFVEQRMGGFKSKEILGNRFYPFVDEFELEVIVKLLQKVGEGLNEKSLDMYLQILRGMDEVIKTIFPAPVVSSQHSLQPFAPAFETPKKPKSYQNQHQYTPRTPPASSPLRPSQYPSFPSSPPGPPLVPHTQLPPLYRPPLAPHQLPSLPRILDNKPPLRSFNNMKDFFELFDKVERGSYAAARLMEAYADVMVNEACIDCWAKHNIIDDDEGDDAEFVDPFPFPPTLQEQHLNASHSTRGMQLFADPHMSVPVATHTQRKCRLPGPQGEMVDNSRQPFGELRDSSRNSIKRAREADEEEEDELERRWRERARKREAARVCQPARGGTKTKRPTTKPKLGKENEEREVIIID